jgi:hypothetical protein
MEGDKKLKKGEEGTKKAKEA